MNDYAPVMEPSIPLATTRLLLGAGLAFLSLSLGSATSFAQSKEPTPAQMEKAKQHYANAKMHHDAKEYLAAADEYELAYAVFPNAEFIFNAAQVFRLAGEQEEALKRYEKYLELAPGGRAAADARMHRSNLKRAIGKTAVSAGTETTTGANAGAEATTGTNSGTQNTAATGTGAPAGGEAIASDSALTTTASTPDKGDEGKTLRIAGIATAGVGVVALGVGMAYGIGASGLEGDVEGNATWDMADYDDGEAAERNMFIFYGVGAAAVAAGSVMYFLGRSGGESANRQPSLTIAPTASNNDGAGFVLSGRF